jgi:integron integrase
MTLLEAVHSTFRRLHYSPRTEEAYLHWICELVRFHKGRHPRVLGPSELTAFLNHLAVDRHTSASTQNQALCAILFLYKRVLDLQMPTLEGLERAQRPKHLPTVLGRRDAFAVKDQLEPPFRLIGEMLYGSGLRLLECLSIRIKDVDLNRHQIMIRRGKGEIDRAALLPARSHEGLEAQIALVKERHEAELEAGRGEVNLPHALLKKMPSAAKSLAWQYLFPASRPCTDPATGRLVLYHLHESAVQKAVLRAVRAAKLVDRGPLGVVSPLDR